MISLGLCGKSSNMRLVETSTHLPASPTALRLRLTYAYYLALVILTAIAGRPASLPQPASWALDVAAIALVAFACFGRIWCSAFVAGHKDERLITAGPYSVVRHPLYVLSFLGGLGLGLATHSAVLTLITAAVLALLFTQAAHAEEELLGRRHGEAFRAYASTTPRWWPRWAALRRQAALAPQRLDLHPRIFWKAFRDAGSFVLLYLLIDTLRLLREGGVLPTLLSLP